VHPPINFIRTAAMGHPLHLWRGDGGEGGEGDEGDKEDILVI